MRSTDSSLDLVHLSNSERWWASPMASIQPVTPQIWLWRSPHILEGDKRRPFSEHGAQSSPPTLAHTVPPLQLHSWEVLSSVLSGCHSWVHCLTSQSRNPNPNRVSLCFPEFGGFTQTLLRQPAPAAAARNCSQLQPRFVLQEHFSPEHAVPTHTGTW